MSNAIYKKDLHDVALAVAQGSKSYCDKRIDDLEWQIGTYNYDVIPDNTSALVKPMPSGTYKFNVIKIYGASKVSENLIVLNDVAETTTNGITWKVENGLIYLNGTSTAQVNIWLSIPTIASGKTIAFKDFGDMLNYSTNTIQAYLAKAPSNYGDRFALSNNGQFFSGTTSFDYSILQIYVGSGSTINNAVLKPVIVSGSTAPTEFKVGYTGIHNLELSGLKVETGNICNYDEFLANQYTIASDGSYTSDNTRGCTDYLEVKSNDYKVSFDVQVVFIDVAYYDENKTYMSRSIVNNSKELILSVPSNAKYLRFSFQYQYATPLSTTILNNIKPTLTYAQTLSIDLSSILYNGSPLFEENSLKGYDGVCDSITPYEATEKMHKIVVDENTRYNISSTHKNATLKITVPYRAPTASFKCVWYGNSNIFNITYEPVEAVGNLYIEFTNAYVSDTELKNAMIGVVIIYELATPIKVSIDWSNTLRRILGHSNGSITATNTYDMPVHSEIDYLIKEVKA